MKKLKYISIVIVVAAVALIACFGQKKAAAAPNDGVVRKWTSTPIAAKKQKTVVLPCGLEYTITHRGNGPLPKAGEDKSTVLYKGYITGDTNKVFDASAKHGNVPYGFHPGKGGEVIAGWDTVGKYLHAGDRAIVKIPAKMAYGAQQRQGIPANSDLTFEMEIVDVVARPMKWDGKGKDTITTPSGLKLVMFEKHPDSAMVKQGQTVTVDYSGYLLNGFMFDSSVDRGQAYSYQVGRVPMIAGWAEAINLMHEGEKAQIIVPYQLAYGAQGRPPQIPGKSDLVFDMHLIDIK